MWSREVEGCFVEWARFSLKPERLVRRPKGMQLVRAMRGEGLLLAPPRLGGDLWSHWGLGGRRLLPWALRVRDRLLAVLKRVHPQAMCLGLFSKWDQPMKKMWRPFLRPQGETLAWAMTRAWNN